MPCIRLASQTVESWSRFCNKKIYVNDDRNNDRIMTMRIPLTKDRNATIVRAYVPTMAIAEENKEAFYSQPKDTLRNIPCSKMWD